MNDKKYSVNVVDELNYIKHFLDGLVDFKSFDTRFKSLKPEFKPLEEHLYRGEVPSALFFFCNQEHPYNKYGSFSRCSFSERDNDVLLHHNFNDDFLLVKRREVCRHTEDLLFFVHKDKKISPLNVFSCPFNVCSFDGELIVKTLFDKVVSCSWRYYDSIFGVGLVYLDISRDKIYKGYIDNQFKKLFISDRFCSILLSHVVKSFDIYQEAKKHISVARKILKKGGK